MTLEAKPGKEVTSAFPSTILIAQPHGLCAGVVRSVDVYQNTRKNFPDKPIFSVGEPAHNNRINKGFQDQGIIFVKSVEEVPVGNIALLGPHGSTPKDLETARKKQLAVIDTVCPLVTKVHREVDGNEERGIVTVYFGKRDHAEARSVLGRGNRIFLVENEQDLSDVLSKIPEDSLVAFNSQTTHSLDDANRMLEIARTLRPNILEPSKQDQCYATANRQRAVKAMVRQGAQAVVVIGSEHSSNSKELAKVASREGAKSVFVDSSDALKREIFLGTDIVGVTAGASVPEDIYREVLRWFRLNGSKELVPVMVADESRITFKPPRMLDFRSNGH